MSNKTIVIKMAINFIHYTLYIVYLIIQFVIFLFELSLFESGFSVMFKHQDKTHVKIDVRIKIF